MISHSVGWHHSMEVTFKGSCIQRAKPRLPINHHNRRAWPGQMRTFLTLCVCVCVFKTEPNQTGLLSVIPETFLTLKTFWGTKISFWSLVLQAGVLDTLQMLGHLLKIVQKLCHWLFAFALKTRQMKQYFSDLTSTLTQEAKILEAKFNCHSTASIQHAQD